MRSTATVHVSLFKVDWHEGLLISDICQRHTLSRDQVVRLRVHLGLPARMDRGRRQRAEQQTPTEDEIKERATQIKMGWTPEIERKRRGLLADTDDAYEIPQNVETPPDFDPAWYD
jgi:hypothetical protein